MVRNPLSEQQENVFAGIVGAFLFSLAGGVLWYLLSRIGILASLSGLVGVICAIKGYTLFAKKESIKGIVISAVIALLVLCVAWYLAFATDLYDVCKEWFASGEIKIMPTFADCVRSGYHVLFADAETAIPYLLDLALGLLFALIGGGSTVVSHIKAAKVAAAAPRTVEGEYAVVQDAAAENAESDTANTDNEHQSES